MMAKPKTVHVCSDCGGEHAKWQGQCNAQPSNPGQGVKRTWQGGAG